jgi:hypothetical protein
MLYTTKNAFQSIAIAFSLILTASFTSVAIAQEIRTESEGIKVQTTKKDTQKKDTRQQQEKPSTSNKCRWRWC